MTLIYHVSFILDYGCHFQLLCLFCGLLQVKVNKMDDSTGLLGRQEFHFFMVRPNVNEGKIEVNRYGVQSAAWADILRKYDSMVVTFVFVLEFNSKSHL